jgi:hypothetical protein
MSESITFKVNGIIAVRRGEKLHLVVTVPDGGTTFSTAVDLPETQPNELLLIREITVKPIRVKDLAP